MSHDRTGVSPPVLLTVGPATATSRASLPAVPVEPAPPAVAAVPVEPSRPVATAVAVRPPTPVGPAAACPPPVSTAGRRTLAKAAVGAAAAGESAASPRAAGAAPELDPRPKSRAEQILLALFLGGPLLAVALAVPFAWGWGLSWHDVVIGAVMYVIGGLGITVGYHRHFTHGAFKARRGLRIALALAGSMAIEMSVIDWVAAHRRHHRFSDRDGDPHSPWRFGPGTRSLARGLLHAHVGWLFAPRRTNAQRYCPDLLADRDIRRISDRFGWLVAVSMLLPPLVGGLWAGSWTGALTAFFWASLVRVFLLHHVTFSINSICHVLGATPFATRDHSGNVWWLAVPSFGEAWHNLHHADPTSARHGVLRGQIDLSAGLIAVFERLGWAHDVRWPDSERIAAKRAA
ncbi:Stearoyl-CoA 9-desaturase [Parafrankia sp. EAN1pec]|nr:Stearoyl-CoA 9-desaturase [Frankia sp. EAN1pec]